MQNNNGYYQRFPTPNIPISPGPAFERSRYVCAGDDDDDDVIDDHTEKHVAHARYQRNHELMAKIFSGYRIPDETTELDVANARLAALRNQVKALEDHKVLVDEEIINLGLRFEEKKRKLQESTDVYNTKLRKLSIPFTDIHVNILTERLYRRCKERELEYIERKRRELEEADSAALAIAQSGLEQSESEQNVQFDIQLDANGNGTYYPTCNGNTSSGSEYENEQNGFGGLEQQNSNLDNESSDVGIEVDDRSNSSLVSEENNNGADVECETRRSEVDCLIIDELRQEGTFQKPEEEHETQSVEDTLTEMLEYLDTD